MEMQNIQNMLQQYRMPFGNNKTQGVGTQNAYKSDAANSVRQFSSFEFKLDIQIFSKSEVNEQGKTFQMFSLQELHISFSETQFTTTIENAQETVDHSEQQGFDMEGYWGIEQTSNRLADFVINGGGDNLDRLKQGREGILQGLKEAENMWGGELPEISYKTIEAALSRIDDRIHELGGSVIDIAA